MIPDDLLYSKEHEWLRVEGDIGIIGITDYAQNQLGDIVYVELPAVGAKVEATRPFGTIEAVKAVSDLNSPISGEVIEVNEEVGSDPTVIKSSPYGQGWMIKVRVADNGELNSLIKPDEYRKLVGE